MIPLIIGMRALVAEDRTGRPFKRTDFRRKVLLTRLRPILLTLALALAALLLLSSTAAARGEQPEVVASGLDNPRGLFLKWVPVPPTKPASAGSERSQAADR
jgi:hypothetical protein